MAKSQRQSLPLHQLCFAARVSLWNISQKENGASDVCWLNQSDCLQACHLITNTSLVKLSADCTAPTANSAEYSVGATHSTQEREKKSAADMVSEAENIIMAWHLSVIVLASILPCLWEQTGCLLPPCDNWYTVQMSIRYSISWAVVSAGLRQSLCC